MAGVDFETVRARWLAAGGKNTGGIIDWFAPPIVERWDQTEIRAGEVADLRFIGAEAGGRWADVTGGSNRVGDLQLAPRVGFRWDPDWLLVCVRSPENGERVLIDGNERASQLQAAVAAGAIAADQPVQLATGDVHMRVVLVSKAISSLWR
ncbi:MAG TPA: hypothetical protein VFB39_03170 [Solirubrobacteraceae bacterium]|nr:hypothetical protein [Solirubrobacteraceae bacterium]